MLYKTKGLSASFPLVSLPRRKKTLKNNKKTIKEQKKQILVFCLALPKKM